MRTTVTLTVDKDSETRRTYRPAHNERNLVNFDAASRGLSPYHSIILSRKRELTEYSDEDEHSRTICTTLPETETMRREIWKKISFIESELIFSYIKNVQVF